MTHSADVLPARRAPSRSVLGTATLLLAVLLLGCSDSSPTEPTPGWEFKGVLRQSGSRDHFFTMTDSDVVRITLADLRPLLVQAPGGVAPNLVIGVALGELSDGSCRITLPLPSRVGGSILVSLYQREYCVTVWDPQTLPADAVVEYTVTVDPQN